MNKILSIITGVLGLILLIFTATLFAEYKIDWVRAITSGITSVTLFGLCILNYQQDYRNSVEKEKKDFIRDSNKYKVTFKEIKDIEKTENIPVHGTGIGTNGNVTINTSFATVKSGMQAKFLIVFENDNSYYVGLNTYNSAVVGQMLPKEFRTSHALDL
jgi:hypothetical protein